MSVQRLGILLWLAKGGIMETHRRQVRGVLWATLAGVGLLATMAQAVPQYTFVDLGTGPAGCTSARLAGASDGLLVGIGAATGLPAQAVVWQGAGLSPTNVTPSGFDTIQLTSAAGGQFVGYGSGPATGYVSPPSPTHQTHALLWTGVGAPVIDLNPVGATGSSASAVYGNRQGGSAFGHAMLWSGSATQFVDLNPTDAIGSGIYGMDADHQVGYLSGPGTGNYSHAALWSGTPDSAVDLNPSWLLESTGLGVGGGQTVGYGLLPSMSTHAILWAAETSDSATDLHPTGFTSSRAYATNGKNQIGHGTTGGYDHALLWSGTAESVVDLQVFLPPVYLLSSAKAMDDLGNIYGYASIDGIHLHAAMWVPVPEPSTFFLLWVTAAGSLHRTRRLNARISTARRLQISDPRPS